MAGGLLHEGNPQGTSFQASSFPPSLQEEEGMTLRQKSSFPPYPRHVTSFAFI